MTAARRKTVSPSLDHTPQTIWSSLSSDAQTCRRRLPPSRNETLSSIHCLPSNVSLPEKGDCVVSRTGNVASALGYLTTTSVRLSFCQKLLPASALTHIFQHTSPQQHHPTLRPESQTAPKSTTCPSFLARGRPSHPHPLCPRPQQASPRLTATPPTSSTTNASPRPRARSPTGSLAVRKARSGVRGSAETPSPYLTVGSSCVAHMCKGRNGVVVMLAACDEGRKERMARSLTVCRE